MSLHPEPIVCTCPNPNGCPVPHGVWLGEWVKANRPPVRPVRSTLMLRDLQPPAPIPPPDPEIPPGRYAFMLGEKPFFFRVDEGMPGRLVIREQVSDTYCRLRHPRDTVIGHIMRDREGCGLNYARWLGRCRRCGATLTDHLNPHFERGYGPDCGALVPE